MILAQRGPSVESDSKQLAFIFQWNPFCFNFYSPLMTWAEASIHLGKMTWDGLTNSFLIWFSSYPLGVFRISFRTRVLPWSSPNSLARNNQSGLGESMLLTSLLGPSPCPYMCTLASSPHSQWFTPSDRGVYTCNSLLENQCVLHIGNG